MNYITNFHDIVLRIYFAKRCFLNQGLSVETLLNLQGKSKQFQRVELPSTLDRKLSSTLIALEQIRANHYVSLYKMYCNRSSLHHSLDTKKKNKMPVLVRKTTCFADNETNLLQVWKDYLCSWFFFKH